MSTQKKKLAPTSNLPTKSGVTVPAHKVADDPRATLIVWAQTAPEKHIAAVVDFLSRIRFDD